MGISRGATLRSGWFTWAGIARYGLDRPDPAVTLATGGWWVRDRRVTGRCHQVVVIGIAGVDIETGQALWELANGGEPHCDWLDTAPGDQEIDPAPLPRLAPTQY